MIGITCQLENKERTIGIKSSSKGSLTIGSKNFYLEYNEDGQRIVLARNKKGFYEIDPVILEKDENKFCSLEQNNSMEQSKEIEDLQRKIEQLERENFGQVKKIEELEQKIGILESKNSEQTTLIEKLQRMLGSTLKFSEKVRNSRLGKIFFRKQIKELDAGSQPQGKDSSKPQDFDDIEF